jgi:hypothetical protein
MKIAKMSSNMYQQYVIKVLKEYCISKEEEITTKMGSIDFGDRTTGIAILYQYCDLVIR